MAQAALFGLTLQAIGSDEPSDETVRHLLAHLWTIVNEHPDIALGAAWSISELSETDEALSGLFDYGPFVNLLSLLIDGYILFAILEPGDQRRHVVKFGYGDEFDLAQTKEEQGDSRWHSLDEEENRLRRALSDSRRFFIELDMASWAASFHLEVAIPEDLRVRAASLFAELDDEPVEIGDPELDVSRVSLYAPADPKALPVSGVAIELVPERAGVITQGTWIGVLTALTLLAGSIYGIGRGASDATVSVLLVGTAIFSTLSATRGEHVLVKRVFRWPRLALGVVAGAALLASLTLALDSPLDFRLAWMVLCVLATAATLRLILSFRGSAR